MKIKSEKTRTFRHPAVYKYGRGQRFDVKTTSTSDSEPTAQPVEQARGVVGEKDISQMRAAYERGEMGPGERSDGEHESGDAESSVPSESAGNTTLDYDGGDTVPQAEDEGPDKSTREMAEDMIGDIDTLEYLIFEFLNNLKGSIQAIYERLYIVLFFFSTLASNGTGC